MKHTLDGQGVISLPGSKSIALRALICATFLDTPLTLENFPRCDDARTLLAALAELGFSTVLQDDSLHFQPPREVNLRPEIYIKDSAAALRFLLFRLAGWKGMDAGVRVSPQLARRPHEPLLEMIRSMGGSITREMDIFYVRGAENLHFTPETQELIARYAGQSSQYLSGILLSAPLLEDELRIEVPEEQVSSSYLNLTIDVLASFGLAVERSGRILTCSEKGYVNPESFRIEEDFSSACYFWALGALSSKPVGVRTEVVHSHQADFGFTDILQRMGATVIRESNTITVRRNKLQGIDIEMDDMPDQVPTLVLLSLFTESPVRIRRIAHLQHKESDRITALVNELRKIGADIDYENDLLTINPLESAPETVTLHTYNDHRLVMTFIILSLIFGQVNIDNPDAVTKSFPGFFSKLQEVIKP